MVCLAFLEFLQLFIGVLFGYLLTVSVLAINMFRNNSHVDSQNRNSVVPKLFQYGFEMLLASTVKLKHLK